MIDSEVEVVTLSKEVQRLRRSNYYKTLAIYILLTITVCAVIIAAALIVSFQPITP